MAKKEKDKDLKVGDIVDIRAQVVDIEKDTGAITVEISSKDRKSKDKTTLNETQVDECVTFVEKAELPEPDAPWVPFGNEKVVEEHDTIGLEDKGGPA